MVCLVQILCTVLSPWLLSIRRVPSYLLHHGFSLLQFISLNMVSPFSCTDCFLNLQINFLVFQNDWSSYVWGMRKAQVPLTTLSSFFKKIFIYSWEIQRERERERERGRDRQREKQALFGEQMLNHWATQASHYAAILTPSLLLISRPNGGNHDHEIHVLSVTRYGTILGNCLGTASGIFYIMYNL